MIVVVNYQMGNVGSIINMLKRVGAQATIASDRETIEKANLLILPGVGAFDTGMTHLAEQGLIDVLGEMVLVRKIPVLGICLGMQLLGRQSEEGQRPGLGWIAADTVRFKVDARASHLKVPHMGWAEVEPRRSDTLFANHDAEGGFYFVHSYHVVCDRDADVLATAVHGERFTCAVQRENIMGVQFHPEKSHRFGMQLMRNFVERC